MLGIAVVSTFSIALTARPISAENFICDALNILTEQDCDAPPVPILDSPADSAFLSTNEFDFSWQAVEDPSGVSYKVCVADTTSFVGAVCSEWLAETHIAASTLLPSENKTHYWRVMAKDGANNQSEWSDARELTVDVTDPTVEWNASSTLIGGTVANSDFEGNVQDQHLNSYSVIVIDSLGVTTTEISEASDTQAKVAYAFSAKGRESGTYIVSLSGTDKAGRTAQKDAAIEVDNDGPELTISGSKVIKSGSITPTVTVSDTHDVMTYKWVADKTNSGPITFDESVKEPEFTPLIEGNYVFTLTVTDGLGNTTSDDFEFGYASELEPVPLPTTSESTIPPSVPAAVSPTANPTRDPREDIESDEEQASQVLGTTTSLTGDPISANNVAALTPTESGWKILGILWYWWLTAIVGVVTVWMILKKFLTTRTT